MHGPVAAFACALVLAAAPALADGGATVYADLVVVEKAKRLLTLYAHGRRLATFHIALGRRPVGPKHCQGDERTPEGLYHVVGRKENSDFYRALRLSYPSAEDIARARERGCEPGGDIMIHGLRTDWGRDSRYHRLRDWTKGCVAVTNEEIEQIWRLVPDGAAVDIRP